MQYRREVTRYTVVVCPLIDGSTFCEQFVNGPARALAAAKAAVDEGLDVDLASGLKLETHLFTNLFATEDQKIGMRSFAENGPGKAEFTGR